MVGSTANPVSPCAHMSLAGRVRTCQWAKSPVTVNHNSRVRCARNLCTKVAEPWSSSGAALTGRRVRECTVCRESKGRAHRLFVCVFSFSFSLPLFSLLFLRSYYGVADEQKWCSVQVQFTEPMGKNYSSTSSRCRPY